MVESSLAITLLEGWLQVESMVGKCGLAPEGLASFGAGLVHESWVQRT